MVMINLQVIRPRHQLKALVVLDYLKPLTEEGKAKITLGSTRYWLHVEPKGYPSYFRNASLIADLSQNKEVSLKDMKATLRNYYGGPVEIL